MVSAPWPTILPIIERPELIEETWGGAEDATAERGICCTDDESRL
jgi:hypothetical protein